MHKFALIKIDLIKGPIPFYKLQVNEKCQLDEFEKEISKSTTYTSEVNTLISYMDHYSNNNGRAPKFKKLKFKGLKYMCFEFKSKHLRYYGFQGAEGMIICAGELNDKSEQKNDIARVVGTQKLYLESFKKK